MLEVTLDKLPGGDVARRRCLVRITLTNTGQGAGSVKVYDIRVTHAEPDRGAELSATTCRVYRDDGEGVLRLLHRALGRLLGDSDAAAQ